MLQKMGWSEGKGLGKNENGRVKHVKVALRADNVGECQGMTELRFVFKTLLVSLQASVSTMIRLATTR